MRYAPCAMVAILRSETLYDLAAFALRLGEIKFKLQQTAMRTINVTVYSITSSAYQHDVVKSAPY